MTCPRCGGDLGGGHPAGGVLVDGCAGCGGLWFDRGELPEVFSRAGYAIPAGAPLIAPKPSRRPCPRCKGPLERGGFVSALLLVERCAACGGFWLDSGELRVLEKLVPTSPSPSPYPLPQVLSCGTQVWRESVPKGEGIEMKAEGIGVKGEGGGVSRLVGAEGLAAAPGRSPVSSALAVALELLATVGGIVVVLHQIDAYMTAHIKPEFSDQEGMVRSFGQMFGAMLVGIVLFLLGIGRIFFRLMDLAEEESEDL